MSILFYNYCVVLGCEAKSCWCYINIIEKLYALNKYKVANISLENTKFVLSLTFFTVITCVFNEI